MGRICIGGAGRGGLLLCKGINDHPHPPLDLLLDPLMQDDKLHEVLSISNVYGFFQLSNELLVFTKCGCGLVDLVFLCPSRMPWIFPSFDTSVFQGFFPFRGGWAGGGGVGKKIGGNLGRTGFWRPR